MLRVQFQSQENIASDHVHSRFDLVIHYTLSTLHRHCVACCRDCISSYFARPSDTGLAPFWIRTRNHPKHRITRQHAGQQQQHQGEGTMCTAAAPFQARLVVVSWE
jgi:hypothetical protein